MRSQRADDVTQHADQEATLVPSLALLSDGWHPNVDQLLFNELLTSFRYRRKKKKNSEIWLCWLRQYRPGHLLIEQSWETEEWTSSQLGWTHFPFGFEGVKVKRALLMKTVVRKKLTCTSRRHIQGSQYSSVQKANQWRSMGERRSYL